MKITGALHIHSSFSYDAKLPLAQLKVIAQQAGLSFLCVTEHTDELTTEAANELVAACTALSDTSFSMIPGFEVDYADTHHVLMLGCRDFREQHATPATLAAWKQAGVLAVLAHPHRGMYRIDDALEAVLDGVEVWNSQYDGKRAPRTAARRFHTVLSKRRPGLLAFAGWDFHREAHAGGPRLRCDIAEISERAILEALSKGNYVLESSSVSVGSNGLLVRGNPPLVATTSAVSVHAIRSMKAINRVLAWGGLKLPRSLTSYIRKRV